LTVQDSKWLQQERRWVDAHWQRGNSHRELLELAQGSFLASGDGDYSHYFLCTDTLILRLASKKTDRKKNMLEREFTIKSG